MARVVVHVPASAKRGEVIEIRTLAGYAMEAGFRRTELGALIPRDTITTLACTYDSKEVFRATLHPTVAASPLVSFHTVATRSGPLDFVWTGDNGFVACQSRGLPIVPDPDPRAVAHREAGRARYVLHQGQLSLSCEQCHDRLWGRSLGGATVPQGHPTCYPIYRLE